VLAALVTADGVLVRVRDGGYPGVSPLQLDATLAAVASTGTRVLGLPHVVRKLGAKDIWVWALSLTPYTQEQSILSRNGVGRGKDSHMCTRAHTAARRPAWQRRKFGIS
jgi:hypothetical protein